jgi:DNA repair photolyase
MAKLLPSHDASLFPILGQDSASSLAPLTGIARLAANAPHADEGHLVEFRALNVRSILNKTVSKRLTWMAYSINPYRGCEFGCRYCYARYTHEFMEFRDPLAFERLIFLKQNAAWLLEQELRHIDPANEIALGTATDPWQPIERRARITRSILEVFSRKSGYHLGIVTKSRLITRDIDLLTEIARRNRIVVHITITTPDIHLARILEPRAPRPDLRLAAVRKLRQAGVTTGILCSPLLPGITDTEEAIDRMARHAAEVGASFFAANPLFLKPCSRPTYLSFVREHFPHLVADYARRFDHADFAAPDYARKLASIVGRACVRYKLGHRFSDTNDSLLPSPGSAPKKSSHRIEGPVQQRLFA